MPRPQKLRNVGSPPNIYGMKPIGIRAADTEKLILNLDEYEALKLADFEGLSHKEAGEKIGVSRPTFTRLIDSAHKKISSALVEGKSLIIEGGNIHFDQFLYICEDCGFRFLKSLEEEVTQCPSCGSHSVRNMANHFGHGRGCCGRSRRNRRARRRGNSNRGQGRNN